MKHSNGSTWFGIMAFINGTPGLRTVSPTARTCARPPATNVSSLDGRDLTSASGHTRKFFGRRKSWDKRARAVVADHDTWKEYLADEPQENTTYATNLALSKLWHDPENRISTVQPNTTHLRIQPLHQVHDALIGQFRIEDTDWAKEKIKGYFANTLTVANTQLIIPFEGAYGPSWGELGEAYGGGTI